MSLLCREFCLKVHLSADWNLGFFVRILQNQIFQTSHHKKAGIFLRGKEDLCAVYIPSSIKRSSWDCLKVWQDTVFSVLMLLPQNQLPAAARKLIYAPMAFTFKPHISDFSILYFWSCGEGRSHLCIAGWGLNYHHSEEKDTETRVLVYLTKWFRCVSKIRAKEDRMKWQMKSEWKKSERLWRNENREMESENNKKETSEKRRKKYLVCN